MTLCGPPGLCSVALPHAMSHLPPPTETATAALTTSPLPQLRRGPVSCALRTPDVGFGQVHFRRWLWLPRKPPRLTTTPAAPGGLLLKRNFWRQSVCTMLENRRNLLWGIIAWRDALNSGISQHQWLAQTLTNQIISSWKASSLISLYRNLKNHQTNKWWCSEKMPQNWSK